jgi:phosphocarrier protein HPr
MMVLSEIVTISPAAGLHAQPTGRLVQMVVLSGFTIELTRPGKPSVSAGNLISILGLGLARGDQVVISCADDAGGHVLQQVGAILQGEHGSADSVDQRLLEPSLSH